MDVQRQGDVYLFFLRNFERNVNKIRFYFVVEFGVEYI